MGFPLPFPINIAGKGFLRPQDPQGLRHEGGFPINFVFIGYFWCPEPDSNRHGIAAEDFKSLVYQFHHPGGFEAGTSLHWSL